MAQLDRVSTAEDVRARVSEWRPAGCRIALVPTMGNLHAGHCSLVEVAARLADRIVVSVFVNPTQFGSNEDIDSYPRTPAEDESLLRQQGLTDLLFAPDIAAVYPRGAAGAIMLRLPPLASELCGRNRPGHFSGVASVVLRLLNIVGPDVLVMGHKDYQQLVVLEQMIADLHVPVELVSADTVRESDGLAMSSRNQYLTSAERAVAPCLYAVLSTLAESLQREAGEFAARREAALDELERVGFRPEYLELRYADDLARADAADRSRERVLLVAAWLGRARLIDNVLI